MTKKKSGSRANSLAELDFVAHVQLEEAVRLIGDLADNTHAVDLVQENPDSWRFKINYTPDRSRQSEIRGTLKRYLGTETRVFATGDVITLEDTIEDADWVNVTFALLVMLSIGSVLFIGANLLNTGLFIIAVVGSLLAVYTNRSEKAWQQSSSRIAFRERDYLLQRIIDSFKAASDVYIPEGSHRHTHDNFWADLTGDEYHPKTRSSNRR